MSPALPQVLGQQRNSSPSSTEPIEALAASGSRTPTICQPRRVDHRSLVVTDTPPSHDIRDLKAALQASTPTRADDGYRSLAVLVHDGGLVGGIAGYTHFSWLHVEQFWVDESRRGTGLGSALIRAAEDEARNRGCRAVWLDTYSFQARPFYEAHGYELFGELTDYPPGHAKYFLAKQL